MRRMRGILAATLILCLASIAVAQTAPAEPPVPPTPSTASRFQPTP